MFNLGEDNKYWLCGKAVSGNKDVSSLYTIVKSVGLSPISGDVFVFFTFDRRQVMMLKWDTDGFLLYKKKLVSGCFCVPESDDDNTFCELDSDIFYMVMRGIEAPVVRFDSRRKGVLPRRHFDL